MKALMSASLILLGLFCIYYSTDVPSMMRTRATSDARQLETSLFRWAEENSNPKAVKEIFPDGSSLRFGGENPDINFREMILKTAVSSALPIWPGLVSLLVGCFGAITTIRDARKAKRASQR